MRTNQFYLPTQCWLYLACLSSLLLSKTSHARDEIAPAMPFAQAISKVNFILEANITQIELSTAQSNSETRLRIKPNDIPSCNELLKRPDAQYFIELQLKQIKLAYSTQAMPTSLPVNLRMEIPVAHPCQSRTLFQTHLLGKRFLFLAQDWPQNSQPLKGAALPPSIDYSTAPSLWFRNKTSACPEYIQSVFTLTHLIQVLKESKQ